MGVPWILVRRALQPRACLDAIACINHRHTTVTVGTVVSDQETARFEGRAGLLAAKPPDYRETIFVALRTPCRRVQLASLPNELRCSQDSNDRFARVNLCWVTQAKSSKAIRFCTPLVSHCERGQRWRPADATRRRKSTEKIQQREVKYPILSGTNGRGFTCRIHDSP